MNDELNDEVFEKAIKTWGNQAQIDMVVEESGEVLSALGKVLTAINHHNRKRIDLDNLIEEFVDVYIMMKQMRYMNKERFDEIYEQKVNHIRNKLNLSNFKTYEIGKGKEL